MFLSLWNLIIVIWLYHLLYYFKMFLFDFFWVCLPTLTFYGLYVSISIGEVCSDAQGAAVGTGLDAGGLEQQWFPCRAVSQAHHSCRAATSLYYCWVHENTGTETSEMVSADGKKMCVCISILSFSIHCLITAIFASQSYFFLHQLKHLLCSDLYAQIPAGYLFICISSGTFNQAFSSPQALSNQLGQVECTSTSQTLTFVLLTCYTEHHV